jgi:hypothetical protein
MFKLAIWTDPVPVEAGTARLCWIFISRDSSGSHTAISTATVWTVPYGQDRVVVFVKLDRAA